MAKVVNLVIKVVYHAPKLLRVAQAVIMDISLMFKLAKLALQVVYHAPLRVVKAVILVKIITFQDLRANNINGHLFLDKQQVLILAKRNGNLKMKVILRMMCTVF